ncbi:hypothetical protein HAX54_011084 [Datura stramonium]|uniref:Uncharacterized protein n=1 Tax=Datura stramonium TaxID=4076 RepID=A0ABS8WW87_DATST|nr:hypothetical protein [Datura stramonium]
MNAPANNNVVEPIPIKKTSNAFEILHQNDNKLDDTSQKVVQHKDDQSKKNEAAETTKAWVKEAFKSNESKHIEGGGAATLKWEDRVETEEKEELKEAEMLVDKETDSEKKNVLQKQINEDKELQIRTQVDGFKEDIRECIAIVVATYPLSTEPICNMEIKEMQSNREQKTAETEGGREKDTEYHVDSQEEVAGIADPLSQMIMMS